MKKFFLLLMCFSLVSQSAWAHAGSLSIAQPSEVISLDPHNSADRPSEEANHLMYEGLVGFDSKFGIIPKLATSWTVSDDGMVWTFKLREGVLFHSGTPFDAEAVKVNFDRLLAGGFKRSSLYLPVIESVTVEGPLSVSFRLKDSFSPFLYTLAHSAGLIVDPAPVKEDSNGASLAKNPSGTGPFKLEKWVVGDRVVFAPNESYWGGAPKLQSIVFSVAPEGASRAMMLEAGDVLIAKDILPSDVSILTGASGIDVRSSEGTFVASLHINVTDEIMKDVRVRKALAYSIDRQAICDKILHNQGVPIATMLAPSINCHRDMPLFPYDVAGAEALLDEAGWKVGNDGIRQKDGVRLTLDLLTSPSRNPSVTEAIMGYARNVGIEFKLRSLDWAAYLATTYAPLEESGLQVSVGGWGPSTGDADWGLRPILHSGYFPPNGSNSARYANAEFDACIEKGMKAQDHKEREDAYSRAQEIINEDLPIIPLYLNKNLYGINEKVKNVEMSPLGFLMINQDSQVM